jgi:hypothetical protein
MASYFQKATNSVNRYFTKGQGNHLLRKGGKAIGEFAPFVSLVNPAAGVGLAGLSKATVEFANNIKH